MNNFKKLVIPFGTKKYLRKENGLVMMGDAVFIFNDKNKIIDEYLILKESNFRLTDKEMIKPTKYYKEKITKEFRDKFLDKFSNNKNPEQIIKEEYQSLTVKQISEVNQYFLNLETTVRRMFSLLSGSNIPGAKKNSSASPMRCLNIEYYNNNFANVLGDWPCEKTKNYDRNIPEYNLEQFIEEDIVPGFKEEFYRVNDIKKEEKELSKSIQKHNKFSLRGNQKDFVISVVNKTIEEYEQYNLKKIDRINAKLRSFYTANINTCLQDNIIPNNILKEERYCKNFENAHIISLGELSKKNDINSLKDAINPFNCLRIYPDEHTAFDKGQIYFDMEGKIIDRIKGNVINDNYLDMEKIPEQTKYFLSRFLKENDLKD
ncbi:MAG: MAG4270 family putative restriction endonuclease [Metamycoplasmataceae bacterium]